MSQAGQEVRGRRSLSMPMLELHSHAPVSGVEMRLGPDIIWY